MSVLVRQSIATLPVWYPSLKQPLTRASPVSLRDVSFQKLDAFRAEEGEPFPLRLGLPGGEVDYGRCLGEVDISYPDLDGLSDSCPGAYHEADESLLSGAAVELENVSYLFSGKVSVVCDVDAVDFSDGFLQVFVADWKFQPAIEFDELELVPGDSSGG